MKKEEQGDLFKADLSWFHIFKELVRNGTWASLSPNAKAIYPVIKTFVNWESGDAFPSIDTLEQFSGVSRPSVVKALKELEGMGLLFKESKRGKGSSYTLIEKFAVQDQSGNIATEISFDYTPRDLEKAIVEIKQFLASGLVVPNGAESLAKIENFTLNVAFNGGKISVHNSKG